MMAWSSATHSTALTAFIGWSDAMTLADTERLNVVCDRLSVGVDPQGVATVSFRDR
jgi:hypothetical protein